MLETIALVFDVYRNDPYIEYIKNNVKDKIVVDCGSGSGIWTWVALYYGAKHVYSIDVDPATLEHLDLIYKDNSQVTVLKLDLFADDLPQGDVYIQELFGTNLFGEAILNFIKNCQRQNISNIFPSDIKLYALEKPSTEIVYREYDYDLLQDSIVSFLDYLSEKYKQPITIDKWAGLSVNSTFSCQSKTLFWEGRLFDVIDAPNIKISGDAVSWEAGQGEYFFSSVNDYFTTFPLGYTDSKQFKQGLIKFLRLDNKSAVKFNCTTKPNRGRNLQFIMKKLYNGELAVQHTPARSDQL